MLLSAYHAKNYARIIIVSLLLLMVSNLFFWFNPSRYTSCLENDPWPGVILVCGGVSLIIAVCIIRAYENIMI